MQLFLIFASTIFITLSITAIVALMIKKDGHQYERKRYIRLFTKLESKK